jgi:hypothetical protein
MRGTDVGSVAGVPVVAARAAPRLRSAAMAKSCSGTVLLSDSLRQRVASRNSATSVPSLRSTISLHGALPPNLEGTQAAMAYHLQIVVMPPLAHL